jgi:hypothetical protein
MTQFPDLFAALAAPFDPSEVLTLDGRRGKDGKPIRYVTAPTIMNRLDEVLGPENWWADYAPRQRSVECRLTVRLPDGSLLTKADAGGYAGMADEGDDDKSGYSDALKRAAAMLGVGRYLWRVRVPQLGEPAEAGAEAPPPPRRGRPAPPPPRRSPGHAVAAGPADALAVARHPRGGGFVLPLGQGHRGAVRGEPGQLPEQVGGQPRLPAPAQGLEQGPGRRRGPRGRAETCHAPRRRPRAGAGDGAGQQRAPPQRQREGLTMDAVEASYVGRIVAWMATVGDAVGIEYMEADGQAPWLVTWTRRPARGRATIFGRGGSLPEAVMDALRQTGARPP